MRISVRGTFRSFLQGWAGLLLLAVALTVDPPVLMAQTVYHVDASAGHDSNTGTQWNQAFATLSKALVEAGTDDQIWIAEGTYRPDEGPGATPDARTSTFTLDGTHDGLGIYGGFQNGDAFADRNPAAHPVVLSGDVKETPGDATDNAYVVLKIDGSRAGPVTQATRIEGITITGGYDNRSFLGGGGIGSGIQCRASGTGTECSPTLSALVVAHNRVDGGLGGGGMAIDVSRGGTGNPVLESCLFVHNAAQPSLLGGGGLMVLLSDGGVAARPVIEGCTFAHNSTTKDGGGLYAGTSGAVEPQISNTIFWGNTAGRGPSIHNDQGPTPTIAHAVVQGSGGSDAWNSDLGIDGGGNLDVDPQFVAEDTPAGPDGVLGTPDDGLALGAGSPAVDTGANGSVQRTLDLVYASRIQNGNGNGGGARVDMGAYEQNERTSITIQGEAGNEGDAATGTLGGDAGWRMVGPPVQGASAGDLVSSTDANGSVVEFGLPSGAMLYEWNDAAAQWTAVGDAAAPLRNGHGHLLFLFDDTGTPDADPIAPALTLDVDGGTIVRTDVDVTGLNTSNAFHVLANPFNTPFDLTHLQQDGVGLGTGTTAFSTVAQIWDGGTTTATDEAQAGSYVTVNVNTLLDTGAEHMAPGGDVVAPWQGVVVERLEATASALTFDATGRTTGTRSIVGSHQTSEAVQTAQMGFKLAVTDDASTQVARDEAASIFFHPAATTGHDVFDASKLTPLTGRYAVLGPMGATRGDSTAMKAQESRPMPTAPIEIPLAVRVRGDVHGTARVTAQRWRGVPDAWTTTLVDTKGTAPPEDDTSLPWTNGAAYTFTLSPATSPATTDGALQHAAGERLVQRPLAPLAWGDAKRPLWRQAARAQEGAPNSTQDAAEARFRLRIDPGGELPVELNGFNAVRDGDRVRLAWQTASETNNAGFHIQYRGPTSTPTSTSATEAASAGPSATWTTLGFVDGAGTTTDPQTYRFRTNALGYGRHLFRLRQVDTDGSATATAPVETTVRLQKAYAVDTPHPNPARQQATLPVTVRRTQRIRVGVYDLMGRRVAVPFDRRVAAQRPAHVRISTERLSPGTYLVRVRGSTFATTRRLTVLR